MDEKDLKSPVNVGITISTEDAVIEGAELCAIRQAVIAISDQEHGYAEVHAIITDNDQKDYVLTFPASRVGKVLRAAGVNTFAEVANRLVYAGDLTNDRPVIVNPFTFHAVRGTLVEQPKQEENHDHGPTA
jgi:hypothetical protein